MDRGMQENRLDAFDILIAAVLVFMIVASPLAMGSVSPWARNSLFVLSLIVTMLWFLQAARRGRLVLVCEPIFILIALFLLVIIVQILPIAPKVLNVISPGTAELYERILPGYALSGEGRILSVSPFHTDRELLRLATVVLVFLVIVNTFRTRAQVVTLILAMVFIGSFEAIYGLAEQFSGSRHIFWNKRTFNLESVSGTFINRNHFAGLLEMIVPMALGLFMAIGVGRRSGGNFRTRAIGAVSQAGVHRRLLLSALIVLMTVAILFSLSRVGITCTVGSWVAFFLFIGLTAGIRKNTLALLFLVVVILCIAVGMGSEMIIERMEEVVSGNSISWKGRLDLWRSGFGLIEDFPLLGTGFGTFKEAFYRYQSPRFGDRVANYLHNDWLQIVCETGFVGGVLAIIAVLLLFTKLTRRTLERLDRFCRWIGLGALVGCGAMLIHSLFDFNLSKITSNALVFAVIFGLWHVVANMADERRGSRRRTASMTIPLGAAPLRVLLALATILATALLSVRPVRSAAADIHLNRYLASSGALGRPDYYFFLPVDGGRPDDDVMELERAISLDRSNPRILFRKAMERLGAANALVEERAARIAKGLLEVRGESIDPLDVQKLMEFIRPMVLDNMEDSRRPFLEEAERFVREAIDRSPTNKRYHLALAEIVCELGDASLATDGAKEWTFPGEREARVALWLDPNKPGTLFRVGKVHLVNAMNHGYPLENSAKLAFIKTCFRRAIASDPSYAGEIFPLVRMWIGGVDTLFAITPDTVSGYENLIKALWDWGEWEAVLSALTKLEELSRLMASGVSMDLLDLSEAKAFEIGAQGYDARHPRDVLISVVQRRASVLGILGRFEERHEVVANYRLLLREQMQEDLEIANVLRREGLYSDAYSMVRAVLKRDWANPDALLLASELSMLPEIHGEQTSQSRPLNHLFRLSVFNETLESGVAERALRNLNSVPLRTERDHLLAEFIHGAILVLSGQLNKAIAVLAPIANQEGEGGTVDWDQEHLIWYYLGRALEGIGKDDDAHECYRTVWERIPDHEDTSLRLSSQAPEQKPLPWPAVRTDVRFGGRIDLRGYTLNGVAEGGESEKDDISAGTITFFWNTVDQNPESYRAVAYLLDGVGHELPQGRFTMSISAVPSVDIPRCGELVVVCKDLPDIARRAKYIRIGTYIPGCSEFFYTDDGERFLTTRLPSS